MPRLLAHLAIVGLLLPLAGCERDPAGPGAQAAPGAPPPESPPATPPADGIRTFRRGSHLVLERRLNGRVSRLALEERWGGTVVEASLDGVNMVNAWDAGREIQLAVYDGSQHYDWCAGCTGSWGWNPVQGGDKHGGGSLVLEARLDPEEVYLRTQPNEWLPDNKGGGPGRPVRTDVILEQWISPVPEHPHAFRLRYRINHLGADRHSYTEQQEFPAVYVNRDFSRYLYYTGSAPWTDAPLTTSVLPRLFYEPSLRVHAAEHWSAFVNAQDVGLAVYTPGSFPYMTSAQVPGTSGPKGSGAMYTHPFNPFGIEPNVRITGDVYLLLGELQPARQAIYALRRRIEVHDVAAPIGVLDTPGNDTEASGITRVVGWGYDNTRIARAEVRVDGDVVGEATLGLPRPDVQGRWRAAPENTGFSFDLDTSRFMHGPHTVTVRLSDPAGNVTELTARVRFRN